MDANKFGYQPNISNMETYLKENNNEQYDGPNWWSIPSGMSSVRILPPWDSTGRVALAVYSHPIEFQGKGMKYKKYSWTCVNKTFGKPCNICQGLESIKESGVDVSAYEPNRRTFYLNALVMYDPVYDRDLKSGKKPENCSGTAPGTHVLMKAPKTVYDWIVASITNPIIGDITSISNGIDIIITKEGSGLGTTYTTTLSPNGRTAVPQEYLDKIDALYNLDEIFAVGFEQDQVNELVETLRKSSNAMANGIPNMASQMSGQGYQQLPVQQYQNPQQTQYSNPTMPGMSAPPFNSMPNNFAPPVPPMNNPGISSSPIPNVPVSTGGTPPWVTQNTAPQTTAPAQKSDVPECFGKNYNASDVRCVTCSHEIPCSQSCK